MAKPGKESSPTKTTSRGKTKPSAAPIGDHGGTEEMAAAGVDVLDDTKLHLSDGGSDDTEDLMDEAMVSPSKTTKIGSPEATPSKDRTTHTMFE